MPHMHNVSAYIKKNVKQMQICLTFAGMAVIWCGLSNTHSDLTLAVLPTSESHSLELLLSCNQP